MDALLSLKELSVSYGVKNGMLSAVDRVSLDIGRGEIFALVGESGCGKSTVAHAIMRLLRDGNAVITGEAFFKGQEILSLPERDMYCIRGSGIGMIFQNPLDSLNPVYRSGTQVREAIEIDSVPPAEAVKRVKKLYEDVRIQDPERRMRNFPHELSGGMRQRVMIAMMLSRQPDLLIADEPTTALDVTIESQILDMLLDLKTKYGTSVMMITHNFGIVAEIADRVGVMYAGRLIETGSVFDIFDSPMHPYTRALMNSLPRQSKHEGRINAIEGTVPRIVGEFTGCRFENRCPLAGELCRTKEPPLRMVSPGHCYCCHNDTAHMEASV